MIIQTDNKQLQETIELLKEAGFIINSYTPAEGEVVLQKDSVQINLFDLLKGGAK